MKTVNMVMILLIITIGCFAQDVSRKDKQRDNTKSKPLTVVTDKKLYWPGEDIIITLKNDSGRLVYYTDACDLSLCRYEEGDFRCELEDCRGKLITMPSETSKEIRSEGFISIGTYRYKWLVKANPYPEVEATSILSEEFNIKEQ